MEERMEERMEEKWKDEIAFLKYWLDRKEKSTDEKQKCMWCEFGELKLVKESKHYVCDGGDGTDCDQIHRIYQCQKCDKQIIFHQDFGGGELKRRGEGKVLLWWRIKKATRRR